MPLFGALSSLKAKPVPLRGKQVHLEAELTPLSAGGFVDVGDGDDGELQGYQILAHEFLLLTATGQMTNASSWRNRDCREEPDLCQKICPEKIKTPPQDQAPNTYFFLGTRSTTHSSAASVLLGLRNQCTVSAFSNHESPTCRLRSADPRYSMMVPFVTRATPGRPAWE